MSRPMKREDETFAEPVTSRAELHDYAHQAYTILLIAFVVAPILAGLDKYFNILTNWTRYLAPQIPAWTGIAAATFMMIAGAIEIVAGLIVAFKPGFGGYLVAVWL